MEGLGLATLQIAVLAVMLFGLFSLLLIVFPGLTIIWVAALAYGLAHGFTTGGGVLFAVITVLMLGGNVVDNITMGASARQTGASWLAIGIALLAGVIGSLVWTPLGGLAAALLGIFVVEYFRLRDWRKAVNSARGMVIGCGWSAFIRFGIGIAMILLWGAWAIWF